jgi:Cytochrome P460
MMKMMKMNISILLLSILLIIGLSSCSDDDTTKPSNQEFIADDNTFKDFMTWTLVKSIKGADPLLSASGAHAGNDTSVTRNVYIKDNQDKVNDTYPVGTIIVKHSSNPELTVNEFTGMVKRGNDFNPTGNDWEWFMLMPDGTIAEQDGMKTRGADLMGGMCVGCHSSVKTDDYVFSK